MYFSGASLPFEKVSDVTVLIPQTFRKTIVRKGHLKRADIWATPAQHAKKNPEKREKERKKTRSYSSNRTECNVFPAISNQGWSIRIGFSIAITIAFENFKSKSDWNFSIKVCWKKIQSRCGCKKSSWSSAVTIQVLRRQTVIIPVISTKARLKIFKQCLLKIFQSRFDWKIKIKVWLIRISFSIAIMIAFEN